MKNLIPRRGSDANKGTCGRVLIVAGSRGMTGAAALAARGALRSGAGLVTVGVPRSQRHIVASSVLEAMTLSLNEEHGRISMGALDKIINAAKKSDVVVFGPGLGLNDGELFVVLKNILADYSGKLIIDADGLNALCENINVLNNRKCQVLVTPHPGEMARLTGLSIDEIQKNRKKVALDFARKYGICVLLKGEGTVVVSEDIIACEKTNSSIAGGPSSPQEEGVEPVYVNTTGNCGMATGGTGDVLSGVIGSFAAQGLSLYDAARLGAYIHGKAGDMAAEKYGVHGLIAGDVADYVAFAIKEEYESLF